MLIMILIIKYYILIKNRVAVVIANIVNGLLMRYIGWSNYLLFQRRFGV